MTGAEAAIILAAIGAGSEVAQSAGNGGEIDGEFADPFTGHASAPSTLRTAQQWLNATRRTMADQAKKGVSLKGAKAQTPKGYSGGGMAMPIGLSGIDPAMADSSLLERSGFDYPDLEALMAQDTPATEETRLPTSESASSGGLGGGGGHPVDPGVYQAAMNQSQVSGSPESAQIIQALQMAVDSGQISEDQIPYLTLPDDPGLVEYGVYNDYN